MAFNVNLEPSTLNLQERTTETIINNPNGISFNVKFDNKLANSNMPLTETDMKATGDSAVILMAAEDMTCFKAIDSYDIPSVTDDEAVTRLMNTDFTSNANQDLPESDKCEFYLNDTGANQIELKYLNNENIKDEFDESDSEASDDDTPKNKRSRTKDFSKMQRVNMNNFVALTRKISPKTENSVKLLRDPSSGKLVVKSLYNASKKLKKPYIQSIGNKLDDYYAKLESKKIHYSPIENLKLPLKNKRGCKNCHSVDNDTDQACFPVYYIKGDKDSCDPEAIASAPHNRKLVHWEEGNVDEVTKPIKLSDGIKTKFKFQGATVKELIINEYNFDKDFSELPHYEAPVAVRSGAAPGNIIYLSWKAVKERIEELEEESMTKFNLTYRTSTFSDPPQPFKKIQFELDTIRNDIPMSIPNNGFPFILIGLSTYTCHLGKKKFKSKEDELEPGQVEPNSSQVHLKKSKKVGCPAYISIAKIARFPDFDISDLNKNCRDLVLEELKDAWDFSSSRVRYYTEYHVHTPKASEHCHGDVENIPNNKFREPVDSRITDKIRELTRMGYCGAKKIEALIQKYVKEELFAGVTDPPLHRRRYNPSKRDIRYAVFKAKEELKKEGSSIVQVQCGTLTTSICEMAKGIEEDMYLQQLKCHLTYLLKLVKTRESLVPLLSCQHEAEDSSSKICTLPMPRRPYKRRKVLAEAMEGVIQTQEPQEGATLVSQGGTLTPIGVPGALGVQEAIFVDLPVGQVVAPQAVTNQNGDIFYFYSDN